MKSWEFRNIFHDLNDVEREVLLSSECPDLVVVRKLADIRVKLLENYKNYEDSRTSPLVVYHDEDKVKKDYLTDEYTR